MRKRARQRMQQTRADAARRREGKPNPAEKNGERRSAAAIPDEGGAKDDGVEEAAAGGVQADLKSKKDN